MLILPYKYHNTTTEPMMTPTTTATATDTHLHFTKFMLSLFCRPQKRQGASSLLPHTDKKGAVRNGTNRTMNDTHITQHATFLWKRLPISINISWAAAAAAAGRRKQNNSTTCNATTWYSQSTGRERNCQNTNTPSHFAIRPEDLGVGEAKDGTLHGTSSLLPGTRAFVCNMRCMYTLSSVLQSSYSS